jgi:hypothetical protein
MAEKKTSTIALASIVAVITVFVGALGWVATKGTSPVAVQLGIQGEGTEVSLPADTKASPRAESPQAGYKKVRVSDGSTAFSFEVPEKWLVETRYSGERKLSTEEMREFLATNYDGDIRAKEICGKIGVYDAATKMTREEQYCSVPRSDYAGLSWKELQKLDQEEIERLYQKNPWNPFPNASVAAGDHIWYGDTSWKQIDFYLLKNFGSQKTYFNKVMVSKDGSGGSSWSMEGDQWKMETVAGLDAETVTFGLDTDDKGNEMVTKEGPGGKIYYVKLNDKDMLVIHKQAKGDTQFESDFAHLIQTLAFD